MKNDPLTFIWEELKADSQERQQCLWIVLGYVRDLICFIIFFTLKINLVESNFSVSFGFYTRKAREGVKIGHLIQALYSEYR